MLRVYTASKLGKAKEWRMLQEKWPDVIFHARWLRHVALGTPDTPEHAAQFWVEDHQDVVSADALLLWATNDEHLRGGLVEAGIALSHSVPVIVVGDHQDYGTWQYHPGVRRARDLDHAHALLQALELELISRFV